MIWNLIGFLFISIHSSESKKPNVTHTHTFSIRLHYKNESDRWRDDESTIDMCINALEIVHAFTDINAVVWVVSARAPKKKKFEKIAQYFSLTMRPSRWVFRCCSIDSLCSNQMAVGCLQDMYVHFFFLLVFPFVLFNLTWIASYGSTFSFIFMGMVRHCCCYSYYYYWWVNGH